MAMRALLASLLPGLAAAQCATRIRVGTFGDANPEALAVMTDWLNDDPNECWTFYRQPSGGLSIAKLDSGDLDIALLGSTPYAAAAARRGRLKAVSVAHLKGSSQALITRARFDEPKALSSDTIKAGGTAKATLATPKTSTAHYIALAVIANAGLDLGKIDLVFMSPSEITAAWDSGEIDGACVWGTAFSHLLNNPWGGSADALDAGDIMVPASSVAHWDYLTGNVLAASDAFLNDHPDLVKKLVARFEQTRYDYRSKEEGSTLWAAAGSYNQKVTDFASLTTAQDAADVFDRLAKFEYLSVAEQQAYALGAMTQDSAYFFYEQKVLAEDPSADPLSFYTALYDTTALSGLTAGDYQELLADDASFDIDAAAPVQREVAGDPTCADPTGATSTTVAVTTTTPHTFEDGSTGTNAYANATDCRWQFAPPGGTYVSVAIAKLMAEQPADGLEVYDAPSGDLLAAFTGRWDPINLPEIRSPAAGGKVTARWTTNSYDENAIGALEDVGFEATASSIGSAPDTNCAAGTSGASCEYAYCLGVVDEASETAARTIRSQAAGTPLYAPNSRCGWRITVSGLGPSTTAYVELKFTKLAIENGFDFVKIYAGSTAPTGFSLTAPAAEPKLLYAATGSAPPPKLVFAAPVFVTFESDGLGNTAVGSADGGFAIEHKVAATPEKNCGGAWTSPVANCALDHCTGESELVVPAGAAPPKHGEFSSSAGPVAADGSIQSSELATDYPAMTTCRWKFTLPDAANLRGLSLRAKKASTWNNNDETTWTRLWDVEASGALTSTTDAVHVYASDNKLVGTLKGDEDPAVWEFDLDQNPGDTYTAVFASDLNNPVPKRGFDLVYAGRYGDAIAGASGGFCRCDFGGACDWPCDAGLVCKGTCRAPAKKKEPEVPTALIAVICVFGVFIIIGAAYMVYMHLEHQKQIDAMAQELKDAVVGFKVCVHDYIPEGHSTQQAAVDVSSPGTWYWQEEAHRMGQHPPHLTKQPHWVAFESEIQNQLEQALGSGGTVQHRHYAVDTGKKEQTNTRTGFKRPVLRDTSSEGRAHGEALKRKIQPPSTGWGEARPEELWDQDALLLRKDSIVQVSKQRDDGWIYGSVVLNSSKDEAADLKRYGDDGVSLSSGWFPEKVSDIPTAEQLREMQKAMGAGDDALAMPKYWDEVKDPLVAQYFPLQKGSAEYKRVYDAIALTTKQQQLNIHSIERVQNIGLWQSYCVKKSQICQREASSRPPHATNHSGSQVRNWLFHGCGPDVVDKILQQGFNRSFCGKNATLYGKGVYFARDASYSTYPLYSPPDAQGWQTIFAVRCVVGEWSQGVRDGLTPGVRDDSKNLLYDTTVDDMRKPSIFVTYHDAQAYPEYRVRFNQANPARSHPKARQPEPGGYRRNWLEGVEGEEEVRSAPASAMDSFKGLLGGSGSFKVAPAPAQSAGGGAPTFDVRLPPNARPGVTIVARAPNGSNVRLTVPHGVPPGGTITVRY